MIQNKRYLSAQLIITILLTILMVGCSLSSSTTADAPAADNFDGTIDVQFSWFNNVEFAGFYEAAAKNYYNDADISVNLVEGGINASGYIDPVQQVLEGNADFGVIGSDQILLARSQGHPLVAVASIYQRSPVVLISAGDKGIISPRDLIGRKVGVQPTGSVTDIAYRAMLDKLNINQSQITEVTDVNFGSVDAIFDGQVDAMQAFLTNQGAVAQLRSEDVNLLWVSDYINMYSNVIFTTEAMIQNHPDVVRRFVQATVQGMETAVHNPDATAQLIVSQYASGSDLAAAQRGMRLSVPLIAPPGHNPGEMEVPVWNGAHEIMLDQGLLDAPLDNVASAYTVEFLSDEVATR
ncbi:MAG: ABC transporter substrate-binding protein [Ardenticatenaceae bacterium]|nr:ABC transporter substrate-binding protein [Ardenticatenaceae bacterium]